MTCDTFSFLGKILRFSTNGHVPKRRKFGRFKKYFKMRMCFTKMSEKIVWRFDQLRNFPRDFGMFTTQKFSDHFDSFFWHFDVLVWSECVRLTPYYRTFAGCVSVGLFPYCSNKLFDHHSSNLAWFNRKRLLKWLWATQLGHLKLKKVIESNVSTD